MSSKLAILIVNWNSRDDLKRCLNALRANDHTDVEVLVIDNGSTDGSSEAVRNEFTRVRVIENLVNVGYTRAVNQGAALLHREFLLLLDSDAELYPDALAKLLDHLRDHPEASVVVPRTYNSDGTIQESARNFPTAMSGLFGRQSLLTRLFPDNRFSRRYLLRDRLSATEPFRVEQAGSACLLMRRAVLDATGPWDERFHSYWADTDWCMTVKKAGMTMVCVPAARVVHHERNNNQKRKSFRRIWSFHYSAYRLYRKHYTRGALDLRALFALAALGARASLLSLRNCFLPRSSNHSNVESPPARSIIPSAVIETSHQGS